MSKRATASIWNVVVGRSIPTRRVLAPILALSVLLRVGVAFYLGDSVPPMQDDYSYSLLAARLASGHAYTFGQPWYPFTPADTPTAHWSFLYTAFLAGIYAVFGVHPLAARLIQAVLGGALLPWMVYRLARRAFSRPGDEGLSSIVHRPSSFVSANSSFSLARCPAAEPVALLAAGIAAVYGYFILYAARPVTETFYIIALLWSLERALALAEARTAGKGAVLGLALAMAALLRQSILPWVPVLFLWLLWRWHVGKLASSNVGRLAGPNVSTFRRPSSIVDRLSSVVPLLVAALVLAACITPLTIRNYVVYGDFLLLNSNAGYAMYSAQHPMHGTSFQEYAAAPLPEDLRSRGLSEAEWDRKLMRRGIGFVLDEPVRYLLLSLSRVRDYFEFWPTADSSLLYNVGRVASFTLFLPFMIYGIVLAVRRRSSIVLRRSSVSLLFLFMGFYSLLHVLTWAMTRYRLPVDAVGVVFAALGIGRIGKSAIQRLSEPVLPVSSNVERSEAEGSANHRVGESARERVSE